MSEQVNPSATETAQQANVAASVDLTDRQKFEIRDRSITAISRREDEEVVHTELGKRLSAEVGETITGPQVGATAAWVRIWADQALKAHSLYGTVERDDLIRAWDELSERGGDDPEVLDRIAGGLSITGTQLAAVLDRYEDHLGMSRHSDTEEADVAVEAEPDDISDSPRVVVTRDESAPSTGDHIEYNKDAWGRAIVQYVQGVMDSQRLSTARVFCMPNKMGTGADRYLQMGVQPENMFCVEGGSASARQQFNESMALRGIEPHTGRMHDVLQKTLPQPFDIVEIDLLGSLSNESMLAMQKLMLRPNQPCVVVMNWGVGREQADHQEQMRMMYHNLRDSIHIDRFDEMMSGKLDRGAEIDLDTARNGVGLAHLWFLGRLRADNWVSPRSFLQLPVIKDINAPRKWDRLNKFMEGKQMSFFYGLHEITKVMRAEFKQHRMRGMHPEAIENLAQFVMSPVSCAAVGKAPLQSVEHRQYKSQSGRGGKRYFTDMATLEVPRSDYTEMRHLVRFYVEAITVLLNSMNEGSEDNVACILREKRTGRKHRRRKVDALGKETDPGDLAVASTQLCIEHPSNGSARIGLQKWLSSLQIGHRVHESDQLNDIIQSDDSIERIMIED